MASIMGFTMKGIKEPLGREGYGCIGTMYLDGTKIGTYTDYGDGACEQVEYTCPKHREAMIEQIKKMAAGAELFFSLQDFVK